MKKVVSSPQPNESYISVDVRLDAELVDAALAKRPDINVLGLSKVLDETLGYLLDRGCALNDAIPQARETVHVALREMVHGHKAPLGHDKA